MYIEKGGGVAWHIRWPSPWDYLRSFPNFTRIRRKSKAHLADKVEEITKGTSNFGRSGNMYPQGFSMFAYFPYFRKKSVEPAGPFLFAS